jgi:hypothetical protein
MTFEIISEVQYLEPKSIGCNSGKDDCNPRVIVKNNKTQQEYCVINTGKSVTIIDSDMYQTFCQTTKNASIFNGAHYIQYKFNKKDYNIHRFVMRDIKPEQDNYTVHHINMIKTDNRRENLRWASPSSQIAERGDRSDKSAPPQELIDFGITKLPRHVRYDKFENKFVCDKNKMSGTKSSKADMKSKLKDILLKMMEHADEIYGSNDSWPSDASRLESEYKEIVNLANARFPEVFPNYKIYLTDEYIDNYMYPRQHAEHVLKMLNNVEVVKGVPKCLNTMNYKSYEKEGFAVVWRGDESTELHNDIAPIIFVDIAILNDILCGPQLQKDMVWKIKGEKYSLRSYVWSCLYKYDIPLNHMVHVKNKLTYDLRIENLELVPKDSRKYKNAVKPLAHLQSLLSSI